MASSVVRRIWELLVVANDEIYNLYKYCVTYRPKKKNKQTLTICVSVMDDSCDEKTTEKYEPLFSDIVWVINVALVFSTSLTWSELRFILLYTTCDSIHLRYPFYSTAAYLLHITILLIWLWYYCISRSIRGQLSLVSIRIWQRIVRVSMCATATALPMMCADTQHRSQNNPLPLFATTDTKWPFGVFSTFSSCSLHPFCLPRFDIFYIYIYCVRKHEFPSLSVCGHTHGDYAKFRTCVNINRHWNLFSYEKRKSNY